MLKQTHLYNPFTIIIHNSQATVNNLHKVIHMNLHKLLSVD